MAEAEAAMVARTTAEADALAMAEMAMAEVKKLAASEVSRAEAMVAAQQKALEQDKLKRIAHTVEMAVRRITKRDVTRGFLGWLSTYDHAKRTERLLRSAAMRLKKPKLSACFAHWRYDWDIAAREAAAQAWQEAAQEHVDQAEADAAKEIMSAMKMVAQANAATRAQAEAAAAARSEAAEAYVRMRQLEEQLAELRAATEAQPAPTPERSRSWLGRKSKAAP